MSRFGKSPVWNRLLTTVKCRRRSVEDCTTIRCRGGPLPKYMMRHHVSSGCKEGVLLRYLFQVTSLDHLFEEIHILFPSLSIPGTILFVEVEPTQVDCWNKAGASLRLNSFVAHLHFETFGNYKRDDTADMLWRLTSEVMVVHVFYKQERVLWPLAEVWTHWTRNPSEI